MVRVLKVPRERWDRRDWQAPLHIPVHKEIKVLLDRGLRVLKVLRVHMVRQVALRVHREPKELRVLPDYLARLHILDPPDPLLPSQDPLEQLDSREVPRSPARLE